MSVHQSYLISIFLNSLINHHLSPLSSMKRDFFASNNDFVGGGETPERVLFCFLGSDGVSGIGDVSGSSLSLKWSNMVFRSSGMYL